MLNLGGLIFLSLCLGLGAWLFFLWAVKSGHFEDTEAPKYRMMDEDADEESDDKGRQKDKPEGQDNETGKPDKGQSE